jgi:hypothetical protein
MVSYINNKKRDSKIKLLSHIDKKYLKGSNRIERFSVLLNVKKTFQCFIYTQPRKSIKFIKKSI